MSRTTQFIGHTNEVSLFLKRECVPRDPIGPVYGMFDEEVYTLFSYVEEATGEVWQEFVQFEPWSSGPNIFLGIKNTSTGEVRGWTEATEPLRGNDIDWVNGLFYL